MQGGGVGETDASKCPLWGQTRGLGSWPSLPGRVTALKVSCGSGAALVGWGLTELFWAGAGAQVAECQHSKHEALSPKFKPQ
jgi:hypothetical protein